jgi:hypothetical protein
MDPGALRKQIDKDRLDGYTPFLLVGTGGSTAAAVPEVPPELRGLSLADSVAIDPPKG